MTRSPITQRRHATVLMPIALAAGLVAGCASTRERAAVAEWEDLARTAHVTTGETEERGEPFELGEVATLKDYLAYAARNNPGLDAAFYRWKAALEEVPQVRSLPDPMLTYAEFLQEVETRVGPQNRKLALSQRFPLFGKLGLRGNVALEAANEARARYEAARLRLYRDVKTAYAELYYSGRSIRVAEKNVQLLTYLESVARSNYTTGSAPHGAVIKAQVELGKLEDLLLTVRDFHGPAVAAMNAALNRSATAPLATPVDLPEEAVSFSDDQLREWLREENPELEAIDSRAAREESAVTLARRSLIPDITLGAEYIETGEARGPDVAGSGKDPLIATVTINLPLWHGKYGAQERAARARHTVALDERQDRENTLTAQLEQSLYRFRDAERKIDLYRDTLLPKAEQSLKVAQQAFAAGSAGFLDLIDAQRTQLEFELAYERALADRAINLAELEMLVGRELSEP